MAAVWVGQQKDLMHEHLLQEEQLAGSNQKCWLAVEQLRLVVSIAAAEQLEAPTVVAVELQEEPIVVTVVVPPKEPTVVAGHNLVAFDILVVLAEHELAHEESSLILQQQH